MSGCRDSSKPQLVDVVTQGTSMQYSRDPLYPATVQPCKRAGPKMSLTPHRGTRFISCMVGLLLPALFALGLLLPHPGAGSVVGSGTATGSGTVVGSAAVETAGQTPDAVATGAAGDDHEASPPTPLLPTLPPRVASVSYGAPSGSCTLDPGGTSAPGSLPGPILPPARCPVRPSAEIHPVSPTGDLYARPPPGPVGNA